MCVNIVTQKRKIKYNTDKPLEEQIGKCNRVVVDYNQEDKDVLIFMKELERIVKNGISVDLNVQVIHNDNIKGFRAKKRIDKLKNDLDINDIIKYMVKSQKEVDEKLNDLINCCVGSNE
jgi:hypothetical protein